MPIYNVKAFCNKVCLDKGASREVRAGAEKVLELIDQREQSKMLLRASSEPLYSEELLRPIQGSHADIPNEELLQPSQQPDTPSSN